MPLSEESSEIMILGVRVKVDPMRKSVSMNNLSEYDPVGKEGGEPSGYVSADDAVQHPSGGSSERKRGIPWTVEEHKLFLMGLQNFGKGDWKAISMNYVKTRTPTQIASHAQKYFLRQSNLNHGRRRSSLFDITTDLVAAMPMEEAEKRHEIPALPPLPATFNANSFLPMTITTVQSSIQGGNSLENPAIGQHLRWNNSSAMPPSSAMAHLNLNREQVPPHPSGLSLNLSLSSTFKHHNSSFGNIALENNKT